MKSPHQYKVEEFMRLARQELPTSPCIPSAEVRLLRAKLIYEEAMETIGALGVSVRFDFSKADADGVLEHEFILDGEPNLIEIIDGCCDISVVTTGTLSACGIPDVPFQYEVNCNNIAKFGPGHSWREDGKLIKPPGHQPPWIAELLAELKSKS